MPSYPDPFEVDLSDGSHGAITLLGEAQSYNEDGTINYGPLDLVYLSDTAPLPRPIPSPFLTAAQPSRTEIDATWTPTTPPTGTPPVTSWVLQRRSSTDGGTTFGAWAAVTGSPFAATTFGKNDTGLSTGTPEVVFQYRAAGVNADVAGDLSNAQWSNVVAKQWQGTPVAPPTAPTNFAHGTLFATHTGTTWQMSSDPTVVAIRIDRNGSTLFFGGIDRAATSFELTGLTPGTTYTNVNVKRANYAADGVTLQWSPASNSLTFTTPVVDPQAFTMLMGVSDSPNSHGGTDVWDGWRIYTRSAMLARANQTGSLRPKFILYSVDGPPLGSSSNVGVSTMTYQAILNYCKSELDNFYYVGGATSQVHSARWGEKLVWLNGNENSDKGILSLPHTAAGIANFVTSQRALYDAVHYVDSVTGSRRFPDASAGSNPTQRHEFDGLVADWLHPSARYHDIVVWSEYPPGRTSTDTDPTFNWPSFTESDRTNLRLGFMIRCNYRTFQAQAQARLDTGDPAFNIDIGTGEIGIAVAGPSNGSDSTLRPYYAVHALAGGAYKLAKQYGQRHLYCCWWDNSTATGPDNILSDDAGASPSTRVVWQDWMAYDHQFGGTHPASWAGNPKPSTTWAKTTGSVV